MSKRDYLKITDKTLTRPIAGAYEFAGALTPLAKSIYESKSLKDFIDVKDEINDFLNPCSIALESVENGVRDVLIYRNGDIVKLSDMYTQDTYKEILRNYFKQEQNAIQSYIISKLE